MANGYNGVMEYRMEDFMMYDFREWRHVFKLDPNKEISDEQI